jgi:hypothetical protein
LEEGREKSKNVDEVIAKACGGSRKVEEEIEDIAPIETSMKLKKGG